MKTKVLIIIAFFAVAVSASAQFKLGVKAGFNASTIYGAGEEYSGSDVKYRPGFHVGLMGQYMFCEKLGFETGLYYSTLGVNIEAREGSGKVKMNPSYLQLPASMLYKIKVGENLSLNPFLGVYFGYGLGGKYKLEGAGSDNEEADFFGKVNGEEVINRFDMGATTGVNLQFEKFLIGLGYDYGFLKMNKEEADKNWYNGNIKVSVGYLF